ncbi:MAG: hypothetical protein GXP27_07535, partial [Planctomycetes bacterium]|nr:hypothetical protein [Planctomycetota bacterium]
MASADESQRLRRAREVLARHARRLMRRRGVTGVDVGFRTRRDRVTREITIRIHVERKRPLRELSANQVFPAQIEGMPVDVVERNYRPCAAVVEERRYRDPLQGGAAIASVDQPETWGTLG